MSQNKTHRDMTDEQFAKLMKDMGVPVKLPEPQKEEA
jgi:hypothetical protein